MKQEYNYIPLREPIPITEQVWPEGTIPLVSTLTTAYNHEIFIHECIEGFLMQKTIFPVEIIIHDDASTDRTTEIIKEYKIKNPTLFKTIFQSENQYSQKVDIYNEFLYPKTQGKYIALCEGDDYWIDPLKLQKQVDFLEANEEYGLVHGDCNFYYHEKDKWVYNANKNLSNSKEILKKEELFRLLIDATYKIRTATALFRKDLLNNTPKNDFQFLMGDTPMWLDFSQLTKFKYFDEVFAVYRILTNSASRSKDKNKQFRFGLSMAEMRMYYSYKYNYEINNKLIKRYNNSLLAYMLFVPNYKPIYSLQKPTVYQKFKKISLKFGFTRCLFKLESQFNIYLKAAIKKII